MVKDTHRILSAVFFLLCTPLNSYKRERGVGCSLSFSIHDDVGKMWWLLTEDIYNHKVLQPSWHLIQQPFDVICKPKSPTEHRKLFITARKYSSELRDHLENKFINWRRWIYALLSVGLSCVKLSVYWTRFVVRGHFKLWISSFIACHPQRQSKMTVFPHHKLLTQQPKHNSEVWIPASCSWARQTKHFFALFVNFAALHNHLNAKFLLLHVLWCAL